jgi:hypothetical protein
MHSLSNSEKRVIRLQDKLSRRRSLAFLRERLDLAQEIAP